MQPLFENYVVKDANEVILIFGGLQHFQQTVSASNEIIKEYISTGDCLFINTEARQEYIEAVDDLFLNHYPELTKGFSVWEFCFFNPLLVKIIKMEYQDYNMLMYSLEQTPGCYSATFDRIVEGLILNHCFFEALWVYSALLKQSNSALIFERLVNLKVRSPYCIPEALVNLLDLCTFVSISPLLEQADDQSSALHRLQQQFMYFAKRKNAIREYILHSKQASNSVVLLLKRLTLLINALVLVIKLKYRSSGSQFKLYDNNDEVLLQISEKKFTQRLGYFFDVYKSSRTLVFKLCLYFHGSRFSTTREWGGKSDNDNINAFWKGDLFSSSLTDLFTISGDMQGLHMDLVYDATATKMKSVVQITSLKMHNAKIDMHSQLTSIASLDDLKGLRCLSALSLNFYTKSLLSTEQCITLKSLLSKLRLRSLSIRFDDSLIQTDEQVKHIAQGIDYQIPLQDLELYITKSMLTNQGLLYFTNAIANMKKIEDISLRLLECSEITDEAVENMINTIRKTARSVVLRIRFWKCFQITEAVVKLQCYNEEGLTVEINWKSAYLTQIDEI